MKIICIGRNYADHAKELGNAVPEEPVIFMKPDSAVLRAGEPFFIPHWSNDIHYETEIVLRINRIGKNIEPRFAHKYFNEFTVGLDFTARDVQSKLKQSGLPWEKAKAFDRSAFVADWLPVSDFTIENLNFGLKKNDQWVQQGSTALMLHSFNEIISHVSQYFTLKIGDLIFTGTPAGVGRVEAGDVLYGFVQDREMFQVKIK